ncbi:hypothetical protein BKA70DRAFT_1287304 [Coprinopsis sp. MPI-PUGE-AT-0042]|nr:hypothetical protein BKA70DRAFT_1287304 [Coprinopsis sp. MPI-PUGE-AT-0042]
MRDRLWHVENARQELDAQVVAAHKEIAQIHLRICDLNSKRNELASISRLPTETLCEIFTECMAPSEQEWQQEYCETRKPVTLTNILHVSRFWRSVALSNAALWANITDAVPLHWMSYMLELAKSAPLSISLRRHLCPEDREAVIAKLLSAPWRMRSLEVCRHPDVVTRFLAPMACPSSPSAPLLEALKLRGVIAASSTKMVEIPEGLLVDATPNLRVLELSNCNIAWSSSLFNHLTTFKFSTTNPDGVQYSSPTDFLNALARMPELVYLELCAQQLPGMAETTVFHEDRVSLPFLQHLRCNIKKLEDGCSLLRNLIIPSSATVALECAAGDARVESFSHSLSDLWLLSPSQRKPAQALQGPPFQTVRLKTQGYSTLMETALNFVDLSTAKVGDQLPGNTFSVRFEPRLAEPHGGLAIIQPSSIRSLDLNIDIPSYDEFQRAMSMLPLLENISVTAGSSALLVKFMRSDPGSDEEHQGNVHTASSILPHLNTITFSHVQFSDRSCCPEIVRRPVNVNSLLKALASRSRKPLRKLVFRQCSNIWREEHELRLQDLVSEVVWCSKRTTAVKRSCMFAGSCLWCRGRAWDAPSSGSEDECEV